MKTSRALDVRFTSVPNFFFDELLPRLSAQDMAILFALCRTTYGWRSEPGQWMLTVDQLAAQTGLAAGRVKSGLDYLCQAGLVLRAHSWDNPVYGLNLHGDLEGVLAYVRSEACCDGPR